MRTKWAIMLVLCFACLLGSAQAKSTFTTNNDLEHKGITPNRFSPIAFSTDGNYLVGYVRQPAAEIAKGNVFTVFRIELKRSGKLGDVQAYPINIPAFEQACLTPNGDALVIVTRSGATFVKLDFTTGKLSTIMEHKRGIPGFRCYPLVMQLSEGKMLVNGYYYDKDDFAGKYTLSILDPSKTGVEAFTKCSEVSDIEHKLSGNSNYAYPMKDLGFIGVRADNRYKYYRWDANKPEPKLFDEGVENKGFWASDSTLLYSLEKAPKTYELAVYDGKSDKKTVIAQTVFPYMYVFVSQDGNTGIVNHANDEAGRTELFFARKSNDWKLTPFKDLPSGIRTGTIRVSPNGQKIIVHNKNGLYVIDVE